MASTDTSPENSKHDVPTDVDQHDTDLSERLRDAVPVQGSEAEFQENDATAPTQTNITSAAPRAPSLLMRSPNRVLIASANPILTRPPDSIPAGPSAQNKHIDDPAIITRDFATVPRTSSQSAHSDAVHRTRTTAMQIGRTHSIWSDPPTSVHSAPGALHGTDRILGSTPAPTSVSISHSSGKRRRKPFSSTYRWPSPVPDDPPIHLAFPVRTPAAGPYVEPAPLKWYDSLLPLMTKQWWHDNIWYNVTCKGCFEDQGCLAEGGFCDNWDWTCFLACCCPLHFAGPFNQWQGWRLEGPKAIAEARAARAAKREAAKVARQDGQMARRQAKMEARSQT